MEDTIGIKSGGGGMIVGSGTTLCFTVNGSRLQSQVKETHPYTKWLSLHDTLVSAETLPSMRSKCLKDLSLVGIPKKERRKTPATKQAEYCDNSIRLTIVKILRLDPSHGGLLTKVLPSPNTDLSGSTS